MGEVSEVGEWDWEERVWGWGWCSDRDSHVEECLSCREQVVLGHTLSLSLSLNMGFSVLFGVFDSVGLCPFSHFNNSFSLLFSSILLLLTTVK